MLGAAVGNPHPDESIRIIHKALDAGINLVDTADAYSRPPQGASEEVVGKALKGCRHNVILATKFGRPMGEDPNQQGTSRRWIMTAVEDSLRRLQTDYLDVYQIHRLDTRAPPAAPRSDRLVVRRPVDVRSIRRHGGLMFSAFAPI